MKRPLASIRHPTNYQSNELLRYFCYSQQRAALKRRTLLL